MSARTNAIANFGAQAYVSLIGILMVPLYLHHMGAEGYGLVGIFMTVQAWFQALDLGAPAMATHIAARWRGGAVADERLLGTLRVLEAMFVGIAVCVIAASVWSSESLARQWLKADALSADRVSQAVALAGAACGVRWVSGLYRGVLVGLENLGQLAVANITFASLRFVLVVPLLAAATDPITTFFRFQLVVAAAEVLALAWLAYLSLPALPRRGMLRPRWSALRGVDRLGLHMAFATIAWLLASQSDRVLLSQQLSLAEFGYFTLAVTAAAAVTVAAAPWGQFVMPRLTRLHAAGDEPGLRGLYSVSTQAASVLVSSIAITFVVCATPILRAWTGNVQAADAAASILIPYVAGNGLLALCSMPYYLQFARGNLTLHNVGTVLVVMAVVPAWLIVTPKFAAVGTGTVWLGAMAAYLLLWTPVIHARHLQGGAAAWLLRDLLPIVAAACLSGALLTLSGIGQTLTQRAEQLCWVAVSWVAIAACACTASSHARAWLFMRLRRARRSG